MTIDAITPSVNSLTASSAALTDFTEAWLANRRLSEHTRAAYRRDVCGWLAWCQANGVNPLRARFTHVNAYGRVLETTPIGRTGWTPATATVARALSAVSSWYAYLVKMGALSANPAAGADRPRVDKDFTATVGFTEGQAVAIRAAAVPDRYLGDACARALADILITLGARVSEVCAIEVTHLGHNGTHRTVRLQMKGGKERTRALPPGVARSVDEYLAWRGSGAGAPVKDGPLFVTPDGERLDRHQVSRFVRRVAKRAGLPQWRRITPHSFRHAWNTIAKQRGASLEDRQFQLGHADPRTTERYDRDAGNIDRDASLLVDVATS